MKTISQLHQEILSVNGSLNEQRETLTIIRYQLNNRVASLRDTINTKLSMKQYVKFQRILREGNSYADALKQTSRSKQLLTLAYDLDAGYIALRQLWASMDDLITALDRPAYARLAQSEPYSWYELRLRKIDKAQRTASTRENKAGLRLVG